LQRGAIRQDLRVPPGIKHRLIDRINTLHPGSSSARVSSKPETELRDAVGVLHRDQVDSWGWKQQGPVGSQHAMEAGKRSNLEQADKARGNAAKKQRTEIPLIEPVTTEELA
jgi:hypothetical protein